MNNERTLLNNHKTKTPVHTKNYMPIFIQAVICTIVFGLICGGLYYITFYTTFFQWLLANDTYKCYNTLSKTYEGTLYVNDYGGYYFIGKYITGYTYFEGVPPQFVNPVYTCFKACPACPSCICNCNNKN